MKERVIKSQENIFEDLGFEPDEAVNLKIRADLILELQRYIKKQNWTQQEAAIFFYETQPRVSNLMNGDIERFSIDKLVQMIVKTVMEVCNGEEISIEGEGVEELDKKLVYQDIELSREDTRENVRREIVSEEDVDSSGQRDKNV